MRVSKKIPKQLCVHTDGYGENHQLVTAPVVPYQPQLVAHPALPAVPILQHQPLLPLATVATVATVRTAKSANITEEHSFLLTENEIQQLNSTERVEETRGENEED